MSPKDDPLVNIPYQRTRTWLMPSPPGRNRSRQVATGTMYACAFPCVPEYDLTFLPLPPLIKICLMQVVVPVVARKKGMGEFYTRADGRDPKRPRSLIPEPVSHDPVQAKLVLIALRLNQAPGTFGYDYSKIRSRLDEDIPMAEITVDKNAEAKPPEPQMNSGEAPMKEGREENVEE